MLQYDLLYFFLIEEFICRWYVVKAGLELLIFVPLPPTCWGYRHVPAHLAHPLVLKALCIFLCIENKSNNQIFWMWLAKMILSLTRPHCTFYNRSRSSYWVAGISRIQMAPKWMCEEFHNAIEKTPQTPLWRCFSYWFYCYIQHNTQDQWLEGLVSKQANS